MRAACKALAEKWRKAPANDETPSGVLIIRYLRHSRNYPSANRVADGRAASDERPTRLAVSLHSGHRRGLTVPRENIPRERAYRAYRVRAYDIRKTGVKCRVDV